MFLIPVNIRGEWTKCLSQFIVPDVGPLQPFLSGVKEPLSDVNETGRDSACGPGRPGLTAINMCTPCRPGPHRKQQNTSQLWQ